MQDYLDILNQAVQEWVSAQRPVTVAPAAAELERLLDLELGEEGGSLDDLKNAARDFLRFSPDVTQVDFYKLLYSGRNEPALLGDWITSLANTTMHTYQVSPVATLMERELIRQWNRLAGFEPGEGVMVSGGSQANLVAMMLARHRACPESKQRGLAGKPLVSFVSDQAHYSLGRAANVLGIGSDSVIAVASDEQGRMRAQALDQAVTDSVARGQQPFFLCLTAGTTVIGAFDPVAECAAVARKHGLWLHIDGAWGGPVLFSEQHRPLLADSHLADSFAMDAHKLLNVPLAAAVILVRERGLLQACCGGGGGDYLFHQDENAAYNLGDMSLQCGRRADALKVWMSWKAAGRRGFARKLDYLQSLREACVHMIEARPNFEMLAPAAYLNVLFRYRPAHIEDEEQLRQLNVAICTTMAQQGGPYVDYARYRDRTGIRLILANEQVTRTDLQRLLDGCERTGEELGRA